MDEQKQSVFRKSALDRLSSPEDLNKYIRVTTPAAWLLAAAAALILAGFLVWGFLGKVEIINAAGGTEWIRPVNFLVGG
ncbi:MAG: hypothetical protein LBS19_15275 [Clostridiales bacterium]|jgi:hypothetical protein|nr:hypothetical protein [Clostridiales bacterium]